MRKKKQNRQMAKRLGVLMLTTAMAGGTVGQSAYAVYASTGIQGNLIKKISENKGNQKNQTKFEGTLPDIENNESGVKWSVDLDTGELLFSGKGRVSDELIYKGLPWLSWRDSITSIRIENGVKIKTITGYFGNLKNLKKINAYPQGVETATSAFYNCPSLTDIPEKLPETLKVANDMFKGDTSLETLPVLPKSLEEGVSMFENCPSLRKIDKDVDTFPKTDHGGYWQKMFRMPERMIAKTRVWIGAENLMKVYQTNSEFFYNRNVVMYCKTKFLDGTGQTYKQVDIDQGNFLYPDEVPEAPAGYHWNTLDLEKVLNEVSTDLTIRAEKNEYAVVFKDWDGKVLGSQKVKYEEGAKAPETPKRTGYNFTGWDKNFNKVTGDMVIVAQYKKIADDKKPTPAPAPTPTPAPVVKPSISVNNKQILANTGFRINVYRKIAGASVSFHTGNKKIASVNKSGYIKGLKAGKTVITTTVKQGGKTYSFKTNVTVKAYVKFIKVKKTIKKGKSYTFKAKAYGVNSKIKWSVSNKKIGKISSKGKFKAKKKGKVYIIAKSGKYTTKYLVKVK